MFTLLCRGYDAGRAGCRGKGGMMVLAFTLGSGSEGQLSSAVLSRNVQAWFAYGRVDCHLFNTHLMRNLYCALHIATWSRHYQFRFRP
jgi:hypothetical protein